jgi:AcrR family transcriptional regulator
VERDTGASDRRADIIEAALVTFGERGYRRTSLALIASRVGMSAPGVLHYFPTKDALLMEVLRERERRVQGTISTEATGVADSIRHVVAMMLRDPGIPQSMLVLSADSVTEDHPAKAFFQDRYERLRGSMTAAIAGELGDPLPSGLSAASAAGIVLAVLDGARLQWLLEPARFDLEACVDDFLRLLTGTTGPTAR